MDRPPGGSVAPLRIADAMPDFWEFWGNAASKSPDEQADLFRQTVIARHPELYTAGVLFSAGQPLEPALGNRIATFLQEAPERIDRMREISARLPVLLRGHAERFLQAFPDFRYEGAVHLMVSLRSFDGATRKIGSEHCLLFGVDEIARVHEDDAQLTILFDHELFHVYHRAHFPDGDPEPGPLWHALWVEGLATHVSERLNPTTPVAVILGQPTDLETRARPMLPALAKELLEKLDSTERPHYADFFYGGHERSDIPARSGYYVGLLVARALCRTIDLRDAARLRRDGLRAHIAEQLRQMSR